jgi:hypothetical protein
MSKMAAIDYAVCVQLRSDANNIDYAHVMWIAPYSYNATSIQTFLINVAMRLKLDTPSLTFDWRAVNYDSCLDATVTTLEDHIAMVTTVDPPAKPAK